MNDIFERIDSLPQDDSASIEEKRLLYAIVRATKPMYCIETGTHKGLSGLYIAAALKENGFGVLYTLDPFSYGQMENIAKFPELSDHIKPLKMRGVDFHPEQDVDFFFCDGFHEKEAVEEEMRHFFPHLSNDAIVVFHDCDRTEWNDTNGVNAAVKGIDTVFVKTKNRMRIYSHSK